MFCYVAALKIHSHGKVNYSLPKDKKRKKRKMASRANNTDLFCAQALVRKATKFHRKRKSKGFVILCMSSYLRERFYFFKTTETWSFLHTWICVYIDFRLWLQTQSVIINANASSRNFQLQNLQDTKLKFMFLSSVMNTFTKHKYFYIY